MSSQSIPSLLGRAISAWSNPPRSRLVLALCQRPCVRDTLFSAKLLPDRSGWQTTITPHRGRMWPAADPS